MNKTRIIGLILLILGICAHFILENGLKDFVAGISIGLGIGLLLTGRIQKPSF